MGANLQKILDAIEEKESKLLIWGDTDGALTYEELCEIIEEFIDQYDDPDDVRDELLDQVMIYRVPGTGAMGGELYRSRMAESVRLYTHLRQWLPGQSIEESRTLVSDFRFLRKPRYYPRRDQPMPEILSQWNDQGVINGIKLKVLQALVGEYDLAGFQIRATKRILESIPDFQIQPNRVSATIVCAGTGSGKTNAFYWPALSNMANDVITRPGSRVRVLALYPRNELLKDQFNEVWRQCRRLDDLMQSEGGRKLKIGAMFNPTFKNISQAKSEAQKKNLLYHPFSLLKCGDGHCNGEMRWHKNDIGQGIERLVCSICRSEVGNDEVSLTRESMATSPPDIVFTTTEMLNQRMGDPKMKVLFGVGVEAKDSIPIVLLDEVHTYSGTTGASTALLLRRWRRLVGRHPHFVGLSATLASAEMFFSQLTGVRQDKTQVVEPLIQEMKEKGSEYLLALRGDAVSKTALLSTTIQTAVLASRLQDTNLSAPPVSKGTWGTKTFVFTDDLDATNRLFGNLSDAEGFERVNGWWRRKSHQGSLAMLRDPTASDESVLDYFKQNWRIAKNIGYDLDDGDRTMIGRTSSEDVGVDIDAKVIVATASLEVGFNDPEVGTVIQHKAPHDYSSYIQRKGRAGRDRKMRPWTIVTLTEFGKDRSTFQHYEELLDPEIKPLTLPIDNDHILRMHAAQATLDWAGTKVGSFRSWEHLNKPRSIFPTALKDRLLQLFQDVINDGPCRQQLEDYISQALLLESSDNEICQKLLWKSPRSIYLEFLPSLIRKLETDWGQWSSENQTIIPWAEATEDWGSPMPDFIPKSLFADLNAPELRIELDRGTAPKELKYMGFFAGLKVFAPGRISKRFSVTREDYSDWIFPAEVQPSANLHNKDLSLEVAQAFGDDLVPIEEIYCADLSTKVKVLRPRAIRTSSLPRQFQMTDKSNADLRWHALYRPVNNSESLDVPKESYWEVDIFKSIAFCTHQANSQLDIVRFSTGSDAKLNFKDGSKASVRINWRQDGSVVGIGALLSVDAVKFEFYLDDENLRLMACDKTIEMALRYGYLEDLLADCPIFEGDTFTAKWIQECFVTALALEVNETRHSVTEAVESICQKTSRYSLEDITKFLFKEDVQLHQDAAGDASEILKEQKLQEEIKSLLASPAMLDVLKDLATQAFETSVASERYLEWCRTVIANTLAGAAEQTVCTVLPSVSEQSLNTDIEQKDDTIIIWLSERDVGGVGIITKFEEKYHQDSIGVLHIMAKSLGTTDYEQVDADLTELLRGCSVNPKIASVLEDYRVAANFSKRMTAVKNMKNTLIGCGIEYSHSFSSVLFSRLLRPNSTEKTDQKLLENLDHWKQLEVLLGIELPINIISVVLAIKAGSPEHRIFSDACKIQSVLWPRGGEVRASGLPNYSHFSGRRRTERLLASQLCPDTTIKVEYGDAWQHNLDKALRDHGRADLFILRNDSSDISDVFTKINSTPLDTDGLLIYPRIIAIHRELDKLKIRIELAEMQY